jgi:hypothetical protein
LQVADVVPTADLAQSSTKKTKLVVSVKKKVLVPWPPKETTEPPIAGITNHDKDCDHWAIEGEPRLKVQLSGSKGYCLLAANEIKAGSELLSIGKNELRRAVRDDGIKGSQGYIDAIYGIDGLVPQDYQRMPPIFVVNEGDPNSVLLDDGNTLSLLVLEDVPVGQEVGSF